MALAAVHQNIVSEEMQLAEEFIDLLNKATDLRARFDLNDTYNAVGLNSGAELAAIFPHLTQSKVGNGFSLISTIVTAAGDLDDFYLLRG